MKKKYPLSYVRAYVKEVRRTSPQMSWRGAIAWAFELIAMDEKDYDR